MNKERLVLVYKKYKAEITPILVFTIKLIYASIIFNIVSGLI